MRYDRRASSFGLQLRLHIDLCGFVSNTMWQVFIQNMAYSFLTVYVQEENFYIEASSTHPLLLYDFAVDFEELLHAV